MTETIIKDVQKTPVTSPKKQRLGQDKWEQITGYLFVLPALVYMIALIGYPMVYNFLLSFQDSTAANIKDPNKAYIGFQNYVTVFQDEVMPYAIRNTLTYTIVCILIQFTLGLLFALLLNGKFKLAKPIRGFIVVSWIMPTVVTALMFKYMLSPEVGIIDKILIGFGILQEPVGWLQNTETALWGTIIANSWVGVPFNMLLLSTGLTNISEDVYESAAIDGANVFQRFFYITLPLLRPAMLSVLMLGFMYTFKVFDLIYVMTGGGPVNATEVFSTFSYRLSFSFYYFGQGAAVANVLFLFLFSVSMFYRYLIGKEEKA